ncbi:MAG: protein-tyrosine phosphatase [Verrucomicrobiaceae bacterium]|nr:protein-tyrosine phosphatase [Verrucomicrobiaceae bacterium]
MSSSTSPAARVVLHSTPNFRDLGGRVTNDGRQLRHGKLFRTEGPAYLVAADIAKLHALGLRLVCDLRSDNEREHDPNAWCGDISVRLLNLDVSADLRAHGNEAWDALRNDPSENGARNAMLFNYRSMARAMAPHLRVLFDHMIQHQELPVLIHCTAGKDRTGFAIAVILHALGVPRETIYSDYMLSREHATTDRFAGSIIQSFGDAFGFAPNDATIRALTNVEEAYLDTGLEEAALLAGSFDAYIRDRIGLTEAETEQLRGLLLND